MTADTHASRAEPTPRTEVARATGRPATCGPGRKALFGAGPAGPAGAAGPAPANGSQATSASGSPRLTQGVLRDRLAELAEEIEALAATVTELNQAKLDRPQGRMPGSPRSARPR